MSHAAIVKQPAMVLDTEVLAVFGVSVTNAEFFRELSIFDEMFLMRRVPGQPAPCRIARPFAGLVGTVTWGCNRDS